MNSHEDRSESTTPTRYFNAPSELEKVVALQVAALQGEIDRRVETMQRERLEGLEAERDHAEQLYARLITKIEGMDKATEVLNETVNRVPTDLTKAIANMRDVMEEKFTSVDKQFQERDTRSEREARDNKLAVDAAFAAQEKQAVAQNDSNTLAITKSEVATTETINKLAELFKTTTDGLSDKMDDLKQRNQDDNSDLKGRLTSIEARTAGFSAARGERGDTSDRTIAMIGIVIAVISAVSFIVYAVSIHH